MSTIKNTQKEAPEGFEDGIFNLKLIETKDVTSEFGGEKKEQIKWTFDPAEDMGQVDKVVGYTSLSFFEGNESLSPARLYEWSRVLRIDPVEDENGDLQIDFKPVLGSVVTALVEKNRKGWPTVKKLYKIVSDARANKKDIDAATDAVVAGLTGEKSGEKPAEDPDGWK